jgi:hypothetical protein
LPAFFAFNFLFRFDVARSLSKVHVGGPGGRGPLVAATVAFPSSSRRSRRARGFRSELI